MINVLIVSLVVLVFFCVVLFFGLVIIESLFVFVLVFDILLVMFSVLVVIWWFCGNDFCNKIGFKREKYGLIVFGIVFIFNGFIIIVVFSFYLLNKIWLRYLNLLWFSLMGFSLMYCVLISLEFWILKKFSSFVFIFLCIDDGVIIVLLFGLGISVLVFEEFLLVWYLDYIVVIVFVFFILVFGIKFLVEIIVYKKFFF